MCFQLPLGRKSDGETINHRIALCDRPCELWCLFALGNVCLSWRVSQQNYSSFSKMVTLFLHVVLPSPLVLCPTICLNLNQMKDIGPKTNQYCYQRLLLKDCPNKTSAEYLIDSHKNQTNTSYDIRNNNTYGFQGCIQGDLQSTNNK